MVIRTAALHWALTAVVFLFFPCAASATETPDVSTTESTGEEQTYEEWATGFLNSLNPQRGEIGLPGDIVTLDVPDELYYLSPEESKRVLEEAWGNPPDALNLGMLFPSGCTPLDSGCWGVTINYQDDGYVSDENAEDIDYAELLEQMQEETREGNEARIQAGYEPIELVGWAARPFYDAESHKLHWARELRFGDAETNTLNYNIRVLGRQGVLVMGFIAGMDQLSDVENHVDQVLNVASFDDGHRYADFDPDLDKVAAYGIGGLIAGKVLAKAGILAMIVLALKKLWFVVLAGFYGLLKLFRRKPEA